MCVSDGVSMKAGSDFRGIRRIALRSGETEKERETGKGTWIQQNIYEERVVIII